VIAEQKQKVMEIKLRFIIRLIVSFSLLGQSSSDTTSQCLGQQQQTGRHELPTTGLNCKCIPDGQLSPATPGMLMDCSILKLGNRITDIQKLLPISFNVSRIHLDHNNVTSLDLGWIENYPQLLTISLVQPC